MLPRKRAKPYFLKDAARRDARCVNAENCLHVPSALCAPSLCVSGISDPAAGYPDSYPDSRVEQSQERFESGVRGSDDRNDHHHDSGDGRGNNVAASIEQHHYQGAESHEHEDADRVGREKR
jgi:hypothetical protein